MYYPMLKRGIDELCIRRTPLSVLGTSGVSLGHKHWSRLGSLPRLSAIPKNIIIRRKHDTSDRPPKFHAIPYTESTVTA